MLATVAVAAAFDEPAPKPEIDIFGIGSSLSAYEVLGDRVYPIKEVKFVLAELDKDDPVWRWYNNSEVAQEHYQLDGFVVIG